MSGLDGKRRLPLISRPEAAQARAAGAVRDASRARAERARSSRQANAARRRTRARSGPGGFRMSKRGWAVFGLVTAIALTGCASENWKEKYDEQTKSNLDLAAQNDALKQQRAEEAAKSEQYAQQLKQSDMEAQKARQAADAFAKQNEDLRAGLAAKPTSPAPTPAP